MNASIRSSLVAFLVAGFVVAPMALWAATTCSTDCAQTSCTVDCNETDVRDAVAKANGCAGDGDWTARSITIATPGCTVSLVNDAAAAAAVPNSSCAGDTEEFAVCITNDNVRFLGEGAIFEYGGDAFCGQCGSECPPPQPGLFTLKGNSNTIENLTFRYFPEGIQIREGDNHQVIDVTSDRICEDAISVQSGVGHIIRGATLVGNQLPDAGRVCGLSNGTDGACGTDKAVQINDGSATVIDCRFETISQPVALVRGEHWVTDNVVIGSVSDHNICQSFTVSSVARVTFRGNTMDHCKFGIRVDGNALAIAENNTITNPWVSAFNLRSFGKLKAEGNRIKTRAGGFTDVSDAPRGILVARSSASSRADLGGGDLEERSVVDDALCASGGDCSVGGNKFCSAGVGTQTDIWNITDCPCLDQLCAGALGRCTPYVCAPLDEEGRCAGSGGGGASIGARTNCFAGPGALVDLKDTAPAHTATSGATVCGPTDCDF